MTIGLPDLPYDYDALDPLISAATRAPALPKTRVGLVARRVLRRIAANDGSDLGDTSMLADKAVVADLIGNRPEVATTAD